MNKKSLASKKLQNYFSDYSSFHQHPLNQLTHYVGIFLIVVSLLGMLGSLPIAGGVTGSDYFRVDAGTLLLAIGGIWYFALDWKIAIPFSMVLAGLYFLGRAIPIPFDGFLFVVGWILQGVGHSLYEKKSPAFTKNIIHLLIGPLWIFAKLIGYR